MADGLAPYPLLLEPVLLEKVWGGRRLARLAKSLPSPGAKYGESWELADMGATSASGAGGGAVRSRIVNGTLKGRTIHDAMELWGDRLVERRGRSRTPPPPLALKLTKPSGVSRSPEPPLAPSPSPWRGSFPLLVKFLDAGENLSVQVHPSPAYAAGHPGAHLKTECWYILDAEPGAVIYKGIRSGISRDEFTRLARSGDAKVVETLNAVPAVPGQMHNLPSGTVHALGAGVMVAEVQTPSDTTYRLYDWGRAGREMHIDQGLDCAMFPGEPGHDAMQAGLTVSSLHEPELCARLVATDYFTVDEARPQDGDDLTIGFSCKGRAGCFALVILAGTGELLSRGEWPFDPVGLSAGTTVLVPAATAGEAALRGSRGLRALRVGV